MYLLGYDIGSSSVNAALVDATTGVCVASDFYPKTEAPIKALRQGWAEQNPESWWTYLKEATASILAKSKVNPSDIKAIGISYQMHGLVLLDKDDKVIRDALIWCDSRGVPYGEKAFNDLGAEKTLSHLLNSPGNFTASKLQWVKQEEPESFDKIATVMLPGDYVAMRLTGEKCTTASGLSEMMLWDFKENSPAFFLMEYFGYDPSILPAIKRSANRGVLQRRLPVNSVSLPASPSPIVPAINLIMHCRLTCSIPVRWHLRQAQAAWSTASTAPLTMTRVQG